MKSEGKFDLEEVRSEEPGMLMTSMIDVIFILLAFFVCVSEIKKGKLDVDVPEVPTAEARDETQEVEPIRIEVTAEDHIFVDGVKAEHEADLARMLAESKMRSGEDVPVFLSGDKNARNGTMMRVVSHLSRAGIKRIEFAVEAGG